MTNPRHNLRDVYPPTGAEITAKSWLTEAPMRMSRKTRMSWWCMAASGAPREPGKIST